MPVLTYFGVATHTMASASESSSESHFARHAAGCLRAPFIGEVSRTDSKSFQ